MVDTVRIGVIGASGFAGSELVRLAAAHPGVEIAWQTADSQAGTAVADLYPALAARYPEDRYVAYDPALLDGVDVAVLGLPHGLAVLHGKTRRGGLVFDIADLIKDAVILPQAFSSAMRGDDEQGFREACIESLVQAEALDFMIDTVKAIALDIGRQAQ